MGFVALLRVYFGYWPHKVGTDAGGVFSGWETSLVKARMSYGPPHSRGARHGVSRTEGSYPPRALSKKKINIFKNISIN